MTASLFPEFADGKDPGALRTIGEVSRALGIASHVLRYWEQQFPMLQPLKRSGRRYYRAADVALVETINRLVNREGYTLRGARQALKESSTSAEAVGSGNGQGAEDIRSRLMAIRRTLASALEG